MLIKYCLSDSRAGEKACVKDKMIYAASKAGLKDALGADIAIQASDEDDLSLSEIYEKWVFKVLVKYITTWINDCSLFYSFFID